MKQRGSNNTLVLPDGSQLILTRNHTIEFQIGMHKRPNYETQFYEFERSGYNRLVVTMPNGDRHMYGYTTCAADNGVFQPKYSEEALLLYTNE